MLSILTLGLLFGRGSFIGTCLRSYYGGLVLTYSKHCPYRKF
jgi:hypothetical protein